MILNRLYELAVREKLLAEPAFEEVPVPYIVVIGEKGKFINIETRRNTITTIKKTKKGEEAKTTLDKGVLISIPRPHGNTASQGFARFFVDTLPRVLPVETEAKNREKEERSRNTFWEQFSTAADATKEPALLAVKTFGESLAKKEIAEKVRHAVKEKEIGPGDRLTFAYHPEGGKTILESPEVRKWYAEYYKQFTSDKQDAGPIGFCTITGTVGPLPTSHAIKLSGVPGGLPTGVSMVSFDKPAFQHYGLDGAANAAISYEAADGYARGFLWLRNHKECHFTLGSTLFLFWTKKKASTDFMLSLSEANPEQVKNLLENIVKGKSQDAIDDTNDFYLLVVSGNAARVIVRDYLERRLGNARESIAKWFQDLSIADPSKEHQGRPNAAFPLWYLANATALESDRVAPDTHFRLMHSAITGGPLPDSILIACLGRLRAEGSSGFRAARMGLIKLCLNRTHFSGDELMTEQLNEDEKHRAYVYGRLLRMFEEIQYAALGDVNASVVDKFYGTFSAAPAMIFARLFSNARNHLKKVKGDKPGAAIALEKRLTELTDLLPPSPPLGTLSLADQGRFALGYYHQKARTFEEIAERKEAKANLALAAK